MSSAQSNSDDEEMRTSSLKDLRSLRYLLQFATLQKWRFLAGFLIVIASSAFAMGSARSLGLLIDRGLGHSASLSWWYATWILIFEVISLLSAWLGRRLLAQAALSSVLAIREKLFLQLERLPLSYFDTTPQGRIVTRLTNDVETLEEFFSGTMGRLAGSIIMAFVAMIAMLLTNFYLGALAVLAVVPSVVMTLSSRGPAKKYNREIAKKNSTINSTLSEYLSGISVIRSFGLERWASSKLMTQIRDFLRLNIDLIRYYSWLRPLLGLISMLPLAILIWEGRNCVVAGVMGIGALASFLRYFDRFGRPMMQLSFEIHVVQSAFIGAERIAVFLSTPQEESELGADGTLAPSVLRGEIEYRDVKMSYKNSVPALDGITFHIKQGERIGLTGKTGSGKTTCVSLLARLYEYGAGEIFFDGHNIRDYRRDSLRGHLGFVSQDVMIFKGSLRENLSLANPVSDKEILKCCERTGFLSVMSRTGMTLDSLLLEFGANLSSGERQLLSFTRVLLKNPSVLILDEATANIDPAYEKLVQQATETVMVDRTCLIIAHRLQTLERCNRILVFKQGKVVEEGPHAELEMKGGYYASLLQASTSAL